MVGFEPTYAGITILCLDHLTTPTILVNFAYCCVAPSLTLSYVHKYAPFVFVQRALHSTKLPAYPELPNTIFILIGDLERARTVDLQRDRLAF